MEIHIFDANNNLRFMMKGDCCQAGLICPSCPCENCRETVFFLTDSAGQPISTMRRRTDFFNTMISDADDFILEFPPGATADDRMLLISALIFMDYCYFESGPNQNHHHHHHNRGFSFI
jgi:hypothetical protein